MKLRSVLSAGILFLAVFVFGVSTAFAQQNRKSGQFAQPQTPFGQAFQPRLGLSFQPGFRGVSTAFAQQNTKSGQFAQPQTPFGQAFQPGLGLSFQPGFRGASARQIFQPGLTSAFAQSNKPPRGAGVSSVCTDKNYLYAIQGPMINQYALPDLTLVKSVELPKPELAADSESGSAATLPTPPRGGAPCALCTDGAYLYVVQGSFVYQYSLPDLTLVQSVELPKPELAADSESGSATTLPTPPWGGAPCALCTDGACLYVVQGFFVYQYALPDLTLVQSVELPKPELAADSESGSSTGQ